jgi:hypothetical protein
MLGNPSVGLSNWGPPINGQLIFCFKQGMHNAGRRPIHHVTTEHKLAEFLRMEEICGEVLKSAQRGGPFPKPLEVNIDAGICLDESIVRAAATINASEIVLIDKVMN